MSEDVFLVILAVGFVCMAGGFGTAGYVDLHVRALRRSGAVPRSTPTLFYGAMTLDVSVLYSRDYRTLDPTTRCLVPIARALVPAAFAVIAGMLVWAKQTQS